MKEKVKNILYGGSVIYSITVIVLMMISLLNSVTTLELSDNEERKSQINQYKQEILTMANKECATVINNLIDFYEKTSYTGEVKLKDMYNYFINDVDGYLHFYGEVRDNCNLKEEDMKDNYLPSKFVNISVGIDKLLNTYDFQYELTIKDYLTHQSMGIETLNVEYGIRKNNELEIISTIIKLSKEGDENNE